MITARIRSKATAPRPSQNGPVGADEGDERLDQRDRREAVQHRGEDVQDQEHHRQQRDVAVQRVEHEARPARGAPALRRRPRRGRSRASAAAAPPRPSSASGTSRGSARRWPAESSSRDRAPRPFGAAIRRRSSRSRPTRPGVRAGPGRPATPVPARARTSAAVVAMLASVQFAAATLTVRQVPRTGAAVRRVDDVVHACGRRDSSAGPPCSRWQAPRS